MAYLNKIELEGRISVYSEQLLAITVKVGLLFFKGAHCIKNQNGL